LPLAFLKVVNRVAAPYTGVRDYDVYSSELRESAFKQPTHIVELRNIGLNCDRLNAFRSCTTGYLFRLPFVPKIVNCYVGALFCEPNRSGGSDSSRSACYQCNFSIEICHCSSAIDGCRRKHDGIVSLRSLCALGVSALRRSNVSPQ